MATLVTHSIGPGKDYETAAAWESAQQRDLVGLDEKERALCDAFTDTIFLKIDGWITDFAADQIVEMQPAVGAEHGGVWGAGYVLSVASGYSLDCRVSVKISGLQVDCTTQPPCYLIAASPETMHLDSMLFRNVGAGIGAENSYAGSNSNVTAVSTNCVYAGGYRAVGASNGTHTFINCLVDASKGAGQTGFQLGTSILINCIAYGGTGSDYNSWTSLATSTNNTSMDGTATSKSTGPNPIDNLSTVAGVNFVDWDNYEYQVIPDSVLLSGENRSQDFTHDIAGNPRPSTGAWYRGPYTVASSPVGALLDTPTVTAIAQTTATIGCSTDTAGGTLYWTVTESATATAADIKAGTGVDSGNFVPGGTGPQTVGATGLTADTAYYHHWVQVT